MAIEKSRNRTIKLLERAERTVDELKAIIEQARLTAENAAALNEELLFNQRRRDVAVGIRDKTKGSAKH